MTVTIFTSKTCAYCPVMKRYLDMKGIDYNESEDIEEMFKYTSTKLFPTLVVENNDNTRVVSGFNISNVASALTI